MQDIALYGIGLFPSDGFSRLLESFPSLKTFYGSLLLLSESSVKPRREIFRSIPWSAA
jgi:hypothetical protein